MIYLLNIFSFIRHLLFIKGETCEINVQELFWASISVLMHLASGCQSEDRYQQIQHQRFSRKTSGRGTLHGEDLLAVLFLLRMISTVLNIVSILQVKQIYLLLSRKITKSSQSTSSISAAASLRHMTESSQLSSPSSSTINMPRFGVETSMAASTSAVPGDQLPSWWMMTSYLSG